MVLAKLDSQLPITALGKVGKDEQQILNEAAEAAASAAADIIRIGIENAMNIHNTRKSEKKDDH